MYYDVPMFSFNAKVWRLFSFIDYDSCRLTGLWLLIQSALGVFEFLNVLQSTDDLGNLTLGLFMFAINLNSLVRIWVVMRNQWQFIGFMKSIEKWNTEIELDQDAGVRRIIRYLPSRNRIITLFGFIFGTFGGIATSVIAALSGERKLPYAVYVPMVDTKKSPVYELFFLYETFLAMPFIVVTYIPFTNLCISWLMFGICLLRILCHKLENLAYSDDEATLLELRRLIQFHQRIISYTEDLEKLVSFVCMMELLLFSTMLVVLLSCFLLLEDIMFKLSSVIYIMCILYALFILYWHANEFSSESMNVANSAYSVDWPHCSPAVRKNILILIMRCQKCLMIRAGGVVPMTLETFQSLLNGAYSYFAMLKEMMAK